MSDVLKSKVLIIILAALCVIALSAGVTMALLTSISGPLDNVFTVGKIDLTLYDPSSGEIKINQLIPATKINYDPEVLVKGGSEDCWLFIKVTETEGLNRYVSYQIDSDWTHLGGFDGVYYRKVIKSGAGDRFSILADDIITVNENLTEEMMSSITVLPGLTIKAYAIQSHGIETANEAWHQILEEVSE